MPQDGSDRSTVCPISTRLLKRNFRASERTRGLGLTASGLGSLITTEDHSAYSAMRKFSALPAIPQPANPSDYPQTWDDVYKQAVDIKKKKIVENPILPAWYKAWTGTPWALYAQAFSEGETFVDKDMKATFGPDTPILKVLSDWKRWWDEELVPRAILTWQDSQMSNSWMKGLHAFHFYIDYQSFIYADPKNSEFSQYFNINPVVPGATHDTTLVGHALHCMTNTPRSDEDLARAWQLMKFYSWRDKKGDLLVHKTWAMHANLEVPFPAVYDDPDVQKAIKKWMYPPLADESYKWLFAGRQRAIAGNQLKAPWFQEWETGMQDMVEQEMLIKGSKIAEGNCHRDAGQLGRTARQVRALTGHGLDSVQPTSTPLTGESFELGGN